MEGLTYSHKKACRDGTRNDTRNDTTILSHYHYILCHFAATLLFVSCVQRRVVEGSGVSSGGCVVHFDVHAWGVSYVVGGCNVVAALRMADMVYAETMECMSSAGSVWYIGSSKFC